MTRSLPMLDEVLSQPATDSDEAGFGALITARGCLPLAAMDVSGRIDGLLAQVTVRQTFVNAGDEPLEATYIFPLPDRGAVTGFRMEVAGRVVEGLLQERSRARQQYAQAIRQGHRASIAEEERPSVFTIRVGNLMPGDVATVELSLVGALPYSDGEVTFRFPMVVAPRFIPGVPLSGLSVGDGTAVDTTAVPDASRITPPVLLPGFPSPVRLSMVIDLYDTGAAAMDEPRVSLHAVWEEVTPGVRRIILQPGARLDRDFILRFRLGGDEVQTSLSLHPDAGGVEGTFALTVVPPARIAQTDTKKSRPRDVVFLLDRSGSMSGWKMVAARCATARMIDTLGKNDRLAVFAFDDRIETPKWDSDDAVLRLIPAADRSRFRAVEFLSKLESRGGTEIAQPLEFAVSLLSGRDRDRDRILVLVTDGQVGNEDQVLQTLGKRLERIRVFTLGIDQAVNEGFLRRLPERGQGGGSCELVESEDRLDAVMESIHRRIDAPVLTDVRLEVTSAGFEVVAESMDDRPLSLFAGSPVLLLGRYRGRPGECSVAVRAKTPEGTPWREAVAASLRDNPAIASAWARGQVRRLEDRYAARLGDLTDLEKTIVATSLRFGVLCRFTAYVAVDRRAVVNEGGELHHVTQPVEMPAGWAADDDVVDYMVCAPSPPANVLLSATPCVDFGVAYSLSDAELCDVRMPLAKTSGRREMRMERSDLPSPPMSCPVSGSTPIDAGRTLAQWMSRNVISDAKAAARLALSLAEALESAGRKKMIHGNLTPETVQIGDDGSPQITGFSPIQLGRGPNLSDAKARLYVAPELLQGSAARPTARTDIYSLGAILQQLLTGVPQVPAKLESIRLKAMAPNPAARYATARELAADLRKFLGIKPPGLLSRVLGKPK